MFDVNTLTLGEVAFIEQRAECSITTLGEDETPKGKMLAALATVAKRRSGDPTYRFEDAMNLTMSEASDLIGLGDDEDDADSPT